ncbi:MAG: hypothetical protein MK486_16005 [Gemmatimonadetes bacterium]|nr:hypothetical protein [Gemmatimonadota bacterium]
MILGVVVARYGGRVMEDLLFGVEPNDPVVLAGVSVLVLLVATAATLIPARGATRVDPTVALRVA